MFKFFQKFSIGKKIRALFQRKIDEEMLEDLEKLFFESDLGGDISEELVEKVRALYRKQPEITTEQILEVLKKELGSTIKLIPETATSHKPHIILILGVNGNGKTTSVAKLAHFYQKQGKSVLIGALDTFRAAAIDQLEIWAARLNVGIVKGKPMSDPAAIAYDTLQAAIARGSDVVIFDTAGRLHTRDDLMHELEKIRKVIHKVSAGGPHETLLVLDATVGQNGVQQARVFNDHTPLTGLILTKLDGSAKGGTALSIQKKLSLPIKYVGTGEGLEDLAPFNPPAFINSLFE